MKHRGDFNRLIKAAVAGPTGAASPYGEIKAYNPGPWQKTKDWYSQKTAPGLYGPNQSAVNTAVGIASSPVVTGVASGGLGTGGTLARVGGQMLNPTWRLATQAATNALSSANPAPAAPAPAPTPAPGTAAPAGFSGEDFQKMMPFLMAILPMLFGGGAPGSNFSNPNYVPRTMPTAIDRMASGSMFG